MGFRRCVCYLQLVVATMYLLASSQAFLVLIPTTPTSTTPSQASVARRPPSSSSSRISPLVFAETTSTSSSEETVAAGPCPGFPKCSGEGRKSGCDGKGKIQAGIATVPGFGWWPIKVYRPCPSLLEAGYGYKREGQTFGEFVEGKLPRTAREESKRLKKKAAKAAAAAAAAAESGSGPAAIPE